MTDPLRKDWALLVERVFTCCIGCPEPAGCAGHDACERGVSVEQRASEAEMADEFMGSAPGGEA